MSNTDFCPLPSPRGCRLPAQGLVWLRLRGPICPQTPAVWVIGMLVALFICMTAVNTQAQEVVVLSSVDAAIAYVKSRDFWGEEVRGKTLQVPHIITAVVNKGWKHEAEQISVEVKKELFYRGLLPLIMHVNKIILRNRTRLATMARAHEAGETLSTDDLQWLRQLSAQYKLEPAAPDQDKAKFQPRFDELLRRVDIIPPALALGQAAYESGYGTSRFTLFGNALFGQWTYGGEGMAPKQKRQAKGDYKVASFDWPLDSVKSYMMNLNTHRSYEELRRKRAAMRQQGAKLTGLDLADTLGQYSEKGQVYVKTLKGIITHNGLDIADDASLRDEPIVFLVNVDSEAEAVEVRQEIERLRASGELAEIIDGMGLLHLSTTEEAQ